MPSGSKARTREGTQRPCHQSVTQTRFFAEEGASRPLPPAWFTAECPPKAHATRRWKPRKTSAPGTATWFSRACLMASALGEASCIDRIN